MQGNLPPEAQEKIEELQDLQETAQQVAVQKNEAETQLTEAQNALDELDDIDESTQMYREVGELLVATEYDAAQDDLEEKADSLEIRVETLEKQEERVQTQFEERVHRHNRGVHQAGFYVLWSASMPGVLVELGFLTNPREARFLNSDQGQTYLASALFRAVRSYKKKYEKGIVATDTGP